MQPSLVQTFDLLPMGHFSSAGDSTQILGVFPSKGNIEAEMLSKLLLEAMMLTEQAGLLNFVTFDGAN